MSEFDGKAVFNVLKRQGVEYLYHANSVKTSLSHIALGGQASRLAVINAGLPQTSQITDDSDKALGVFNDVFFDFVDIHNRTSNRNKYGPVLFRWNLELLNFLPENATVLITKSNPSKWQNGDLPESRYFLTIEDLMENFSHGDFNQMLMIRLPSGLVKFDQNFLDILVDDPVELNCRPSSVHTRAAHDIGNSLTAMGINATVGTRNCRANCLCTKEYAVKATRIPYFFDK